MSDIAFKDLLERPREDRLILQFSTAAPDWRHWTPASLKGWPLNMLFDKNYGSSLIRRSCHSPFSHVDMVMKDGTLLGASDSPDAPHIHGNPKGVASRPFDYQAFAYRRQMVIATPRADDIRRLATTQLGKPFDHGGLSDFVSDKFPGLRDWRLDESWFCAELCVWAMETGYFWGPPPLAWPANRISPTDLILLMMPDDRFENRDTFWNPIPGLKLGPGET